MNDTIRTQLAHSSVRAFTNEPVTAELRTQILDAARAASTSCALQVTSIIRVTDPALRARIAELSGGQAHVAAAPEFWVFCADYHRLQLLCPEADLGWIEQFLVGCLDTGIMAQNAFTALESLRLGGCFIGGIRNGITEVSALLRLPQNVFPVVGIAFGHPAVRNPVKPRLPPPSPSWKTATKNPRQPNLTLMTQRCEPTTLDAEAMPARRPSATLSIPSSPASAAGSCSIICRRRASR